MMNMHIKVNNYEILNLEADTLIYSKCGITKINSKPLTSLLADLKPLENKILQDEHFQFLLSTYSLDHGDTLEFLIATATLQRVKKQPHYTNATVYYDWDCNNQLQELICKKTTENVEFKKLDHLSTTHKNQKQLIIIATFNVHPNTLRDAYFKISTSNPESAIIFGYFIENKYHLSQPYIPTTGNPCAFCQIDKITNFETLRPGTSQWAKLLKFCFSPPLAIPQSTPSVLQHSLILGLILKK